MTLDSLIDRIMNYDKWPDIQLPENLDLLNELADVNFIKGTFEGMLAATLMYHQVLEAMCIHLLDNCHFFIQLSVYPAEIHFKIPTDKMFGYYITELKKSVSFFKKDEFMHKAEQLNSYRVNVVHKMRRSNLKELSSELQNVKPCFDEIYELYDEIQDDFHVTFHSFRKDAFIDYLTEEEYHQYFE